MARRKVKAWLLTRTNLPDLSATVYRDSDTKEYVVVYYEGRNKIGDSFHTDKDDAEGTANAELARMGKLFATKHVQKPPRTHGRLKNAASQEEINQFVKQHDAVTLYASGAYGRRPTVKDWEAGKDFMAVNPAVWEGGPYFSIRDVETIYGLGYTKIIFGGAEGFDVDLVMQ